MLKLTAMVVNFPIFNALTSISQRLKYNAYTLVGPLSVCCSYERSEGEKRGEHEEMSMYEFTSSRTLLLESVVLVSTDIVGTEERIMVLQESMKAVVEALQGCEQKELAVNAREILK